MLTSPEEGPIQSHDAVLLATSVEEGQDDV